ncbi:MAG TPA: glycosyltransferase family 4 protein, partial [Methylomirabilota bacterium]|nr:glycosyltransferase family 4 protein [Methylomirabilota bacterium]
REAVREDRDGVAIHRLPPMPLGADGALTFPAFVNPVWLAAIAGVVRRQGADVILVRDLPLALAGIAVGRLTGRPVVLDFAENYPAMLRDFWPANRRRPLNWVARHPRVAAVVERLAVRGADHILVVVQEALERVRDLGVPAARLSVVANTPLPERFAGLEARAREAEAASPTFDLVYLGFLDAARGVDTAIAAMPAVVARVPDARLVVVGSGGDEARLRGLAAASGAGGHIRFAGWVPHEAAYEWIARSAVGLVPHRATPSWMTTIPNKLFDYMALAKPVVASDARPVRRIVETEACGLVFPSGDAEALAAQVVRLRDAALRHRLGDNGRAAVRARYNWTVDETTLLGALEATRTASRPAPAGLVRSVRD